MPFRSREDEDSRLDAAGASGSGQNEDADVAGEPACWAHLVCPSCSAVLTEGHQPGCELAPAQRGQVLPCRGQRRDGDRYHLRPTAGLRAALSATNKGYERWI
jgi:hypothetical protein